MKDKTQADWKKDLLIKMTEKDIEGAKAALANIEDVNQHDNPDEITFLHYAAKFMPEIIEDLVRKGADATAVDSDGKTPNDILKKHPENDFSKRRAMRVLSDAKPSKSRIRHRRASHTAVETKSEQELVDELFEKIKTGDVKGAKQALSKIDTVGSSLDLDGKTAMYYAMEHMPEIIGDLASKGADVRTENKREETPLHLAVKNRDIASITKLIKAGADVDAEDERGVAVKELVSKDDIELYSLLNSFAEKLAPKRTTRREVAADSPPMTRTLARQGRKAPPPSLFSGSASPSAAGDSSSAETTSPSTPFIEINEEDRTPSPISALPSTPENTPKAPPPATPIGTPEAPSPATPESVLSEEIKESADEAAKPLTRKLKETGRRAAKPAPLPKTSFRSR